MAIQIGKNTAYGGPNVTEKYSPLHNIVFTSARDDRPICDGLLTNRAQLLRSAGLHGQYLVLIAPDWDAITAAEGPRQLAPLVVVSSNRAEWIARGLRAARDQLVASGGTTFFGAATEGVLSEVDARALTQEEPTAPPGGPAPEPTVSPPIYAPERAGPGRGIYVVVHATEYVMYKRTLRNLGVTPIGWQFAEITPRPGPHGPELVGFGATRFAAIEFCKQMRRDGNAHWRLAWLFDDNVVAMGGFAGFEAVEAPVGQNACAGFKGGTAAMPRSHARDQAKGHGFGATALPPSTPPGLVQQAALWNVEQLDTRRLSFGPAYLASAEDASFAKYLDWKRIPYQFYKAITIYKEDPAQDNSEGAQALGRRRTALTAWVSAAESSDQQPAAGRQPPPPLTVEGDRVAQTLSKYVDDHVLKEAKAVNPNDPNVRAKAKCQGVEQITTKALEQQYISAQPAEATFRINGNNPQPIAFRDAP